MVIYTGVIYCWSSAVVDNLGSWDSRFLSVFVVGDTTTAATNDQIVKYLCWSGRILLAGTFPHEDFYGRPWPEKSWRQKKAGSCIAGPFGCAFVACTHDAKARYQTHCFRNWYNCQFICDSCPACVHIRQLNHANYRRDARWRPHQITHQQYIENTPPESLSPWLGMPGFVLSRALWDLMHTIHLGIAKDLCAQVMADLCRLGYEGDGPLAQQLRRLWIRFRLYCSRHSIPYSRRKFSPKIIGISDTGGLEFPELNSRTKAAHVKPIISFLAYRCKKILAPKFKKAEDRNSELRAWACFGLADFLHTLDNAGTLLTEAEVAKARISGRIYLLSWQSLAHAACAQGLCAYKCRPKGHYFDHLLQQLDTLENPKGLSNFLSEDFIGKIVRLAKQQHRISCVRRTVELYSMALRHRWRHVKTFFAGWSCNLANCVGFMCPLPSLGPLSSKPSHQI